jgi:hypothetical protein
MKSASGDGYGALYEIEPTLLLFAHRCGLDSPFLPLKSVHARLNGANCPIVISSKS